MKYDAVYINYMSFAQSQLKYHKMRDYNFFIRVCDEVAIE